MADNKTSKECLINAVCSKNGLRLLRIFLFSPGLELYQSQFVRDYHMSISSISGVLKTFEVNNILRVSRKGDIKLYSLNENNPVCRQQKILINVSEIYESMKGLGGSTTSVYLFGRAARGEDTKEDEIDLLVITDLKKAEVYRYADMLVKATGREVNPAIYTRSQYASLPEGEKRQYEPVTNLIRIL